MLLIQNLQVNWDKSTRGALEGAKRRAVPEAFTFPAGTLPQIDEVWIHRLGAGNSGELGSQGATKLERAEVFEFPIFYSALEIRLGMDQCHILRRESSVPIITLNRGESGRVRLQGCNYGYEHIWYEKHVFNVALLKRYDSEIFRLRPFTHTYDDLPELRFAPSSTH